MESGYRESTESWSEVLRNLRDRGLARPLAAVGDGALGLWAALDQVFPTTEHQRCWNHRVLNVQSKLPKRLQAEVRRRLREMWESETQALCEERRDGTPMWQSCVTRVREQRRKQCCGTGQTSSPSTIFPRNTGSIWGPATPLSPSSVESGCGPMRLGGCAVGTMSSTWCSRWWNGSAETGGR